jgi:uncharacterized circularly permuted ATP-grasp superfamily protein
LRALAERSEREVNDTLSLTERQIREHGITYNVYADAQGVHRPWEVDPIPLVLPANEWATIAAGIEQRADLLNRVLGDLYGPQTLMKGGAIPPSVIFGHRGFLAPVEGWRPVGGRHLLQYAADLARSPDGRWWVVNDRTQAPSGSGYALENRLVVSRVFPQMFRELPVQHLASFFDALPVASNPAAVRACAMLIDASAFSSALSAPVRTSIDDALESDFASRFPVRLSAQSATRYLGFGVRWRSSFRYAAIFGSDRSA